MLDINYIRKYPNKVKQACQHKNLDPQVVDQLLTIDSRRRQLLTQIQQLRTHKNLLTQQLKTHRTPALISQANQLKDKLRQLTPQLRQLEIDFHNLLLHIPNIPLEEVPIGKDERDNRLYRTWGQKPTFNFPPKDHIQLGLSLGILDLKRGSKVAGFRGYYLKNEGVILQMALMRYALDKFIKKGYTPFLPPVIDKRAAFINSGHFPWGEKETYRLAKDETDPKNDYFLAGTAEVPLVSYYAGEVLKEKDLPIKMVGYSPCFRREIGNYGKDTKGIYRVHEFYKVEQVVICKNDLQESRRLHEQMLRFTEEINQDFGLHYRVMLMCTGDMGEPQAKKYDIETWMPGRNTYGETASDSIVTDFQARRANIKYQAKDGTIKYVHMLNNTALPSTRMLIAILENYQQEDGSVRIPEPLIPYTGFKLLKPRSSS